MSPTLRELGSVRSAAVVNAEIRALWARSGARLSAVDEARYQQLLVEWAAAVGAEADARTDADVILGAGVTAGVAAGAGEAPGVGAGASVSAGVGAAPGTSGAGIADAA
ncbi:hypothetical protein ACWGI8_40175 [Streptomyces sp. NPDC054841]